ncbi:MAG: acyl-phosphate glycerol 3-phosphate acyltransferase, partial [Bacteroidetes bacterium HGW-Bacteroidetes-22]
MDWILIISGIIVAYLIGSFSSAVLIGKWFFNIDVRQYGSGNAGATNTIRVLGPKVGVIILLLDVFKGWLAVWLFGLFASTLTEPSASYIRLLYAFAVVMGHVFPLYTSFRGGKGVATLLGVALALFPTAALIVILWFIIILWIFRYVSLGSITGAILFPFLVIFLLPGPAPTTPLVIL